jgi:hypothetical protein
MRSPRFHVGTWMSFSVAAGSAASSCAGRYCVVGRVSSSAGTSASAAAIIVCRSSTIVTTASAGGGGVANGCVRPSVGTIRTVVHVGGPCAGNRHYNRN